MNKRDLLKLGIAVPAVALTDKVAKETEKTQIFDANQAVRWDEPVVVSAGFFVGPTSTATFFPEKYRK